MAVSGSTWFMKGLRRLAESGANKIDWDDAAQTIFAMLVTGGATAAQFPQPATEADIDALETLATVVSNGGALSTKRLAGTTDQAVGATSKTLTEDTADDQLQFIASPAFIEFTAVPTGEPARGVIIYRQVAGADASRYVMGFLKFAADLPTNGSNIRVTWHADGLFTIDYT